MTTSDTAAALASALPDENVRAFDDRGDRISLTLLASVQADRLAEQGWVLVRPDDEATVERVARELSRTVGDFVFDGNDHGVGPDEYREQARATLAALAARPGTADTEPAEVDRG